MPESKLTFLSWTRERVGDLVTGTQEGRARAETSVTLTGRDASGDVTGTQTRTLSFLLAGPPDVTGLTPPAIVGRYPRPGTIDAESDKCVHVELADPALPWRYTPHANPAEGTGALRPWLALVVGVEGDELMLAGDRVTLAVEAQHLHPLPDPTPFPWAHVQVDDNGRRTARVLSGRQLAAGQDYLAVLVPAFAPEGGKAWTGTEPVTLPAYDHWRFRTATPEGSFRDLAARLQPGDAPPDTGRAPVVYPRLSAAPDLEVRGALAPIGSADAALPDEIATDLAAIAGPDVATTDDVGRPVVGLPRYGEPWAPSPHDTAWGNELNGDPRQRGSAGLGLELGIRLQEELMTDVAEHAGALDVAAQRIGDLVLGLESSRALWERRLPADPQRRLWTLGPGLRRLVTDDGAVADLATADDRPLPPGLFSTAARRVLRAGPARTARAGDAASDPRALLEQANRCPPPPTPSLDGVPLDVDPGTLAERLREAVERGRLDPSALAESLESLRLDRVHPKLHQAAEVLRRQLLIALHDRRTAPYVQGFELLLLVATTDPDDERGVDDLSRRLHELLEAFRQIGEDPDALLVLLREMIEPPLDEPPCRPVDLDRLADGVLAAYDPTRPASAARLRVLDTIDGLDPDQPLAPPEVCASLDRPVWRDLSDELPEWLLPGVGRLPEDSVIALESNPRFIDAVMVGYNTQLLAEARWRNQRIRSGCTPLRVFWDRADVETGEPLDDIVGIHAWPGSSELGAAEHRPGGDGDGDLVVVLRGQLFLRYPRTIVYLTSAVHDGTVDFDADPDDDAPRTLPTFQGRIGADVTFFGFHGVSGEAVRECFVVLEEPPQGYRFYNAGEVTPPAGADGAAFAHDAFAPPVRVLIRGDRLLPEEDE